MYKLVITLLARRVGWMLMNDVSSEARNKINEETTKKFFTFSTKKVGCIMKKKFSISDYNNLMNSNS